MDSIPGPQVRKRTARWRPPVWWSGPCPGQLEIGFDVPTVEPPPKPKRKRAARSWMQPPLDLGPVRRVPRAVEEPGPEWPPFEVTVEMLDGD